MSKAKVPAGWEFWVVALWVCILGSCSSSPQHPPTFEDFRRAQRNGLDSPEAINSLVKLMELAQFSKAEQERILQRGKVEELIGAAMEAPLSDPMALRLLNRATKLNESDFLPWQAMVSRHLSLLLNKQKDYDSEKQFEIAIDRLMSLKPENAFPVYLRALGCTLKNNIPEARRFMEVAGQKPAFYTSNRKLRECVVLAAEATGYPKYTARMIALGQSRNTIPLVRLAKVLLTNAPPDEPTARACLRMGQQLEADSQLFLEHMLAFNIQKEALKHLGGDSQAMMNQHIDEKKKRIQQATAFLESDAVKRVSEQRWVRYFDSVFRTSEMEATEHLASELGKPLAAQVPK
ncbi:MAG: hypothetical protein JWP08_1477 [Bryobacterales bacterium]|nr:hypothetical protein [Bryobacterales bacterium]